MQPALAEFRITRLLVETGSSCVYEAVALRDGRACIAKVFDISDETLTATVEQEFELIRGLDIEGVARAVSLQRVGDQLALLLERAPGVDLRTLADGKALPLALFFDIAVQVSEILAKTHARRVVHRDIKPANLLYDTQSGRVHIADFGISVLLESERRHIYDARVLVGTLPYISPEQTGRTNRSVDFRSDLYSLGVTFYELLTGRRPFESMAPLELIHAHLARTPAAPIELRPELPEPLSRLVMKLLAKPPEQRYQTAAGLASDLRALGRLLAAGPIDAVSGPRPRPEPEPSRAEASFELGREDRSTSLRLPAQLYGRARELLGSHDSSLELEAVLRSVGFTAELPFEQVLLRLLDAAMTNVGADHGLLLLERDGELALVAEARTGDGHREVLRRSVRLRELGDRGPSTIINLVARTGEPLVLDDASNDPRFAGDPYLELHEVRSLLATPIVRDTLLGVLVVENRCATHGFAPKSVETVRLITGQVASTLDNARLRSALRRSEDRWRSLLDGAPDLIALLDQHAKVVVINRGRIGEHGDADFITAMTERARASWAAAVEQVLEEGLPAELELELDGDLEPNEVAGPRWFAVRIAPIELGKQDIGDGHDAGPRRNAVVVATDISDRKRAEVERAELETQLRQQQRLESLGTLASGIAHEINNPVQGIMNYAELIVANVDDRDTVIEFAGEISHETERVATIVRNLLAFSRQDRDQRLESTDLASLVNGTLSLLHAVLRKDHIRVDVDIPPLPVRCRVQQIQQIVLNLVTNARDALNQHYPEIDARRKIEIRGESSPGGRVRLIVQDHGPGIPDAVLAHIFDPFFTTKGRDKGTGLGLSVSHGIAKEHGGDILVETRLGEGTRFIVELPA